MTWLLALLAWWAAVVPLAAQDPPSDDGTAAPAADDTVEVTRATVAGKPGHRDVREVRVLVRDAGRLDWSQRDEIVFDRPDHDGFYDIFRTDAAGDGAICITCENYDLHKKHALAPVWHPGGEYLVVQVQMVAKKLAMDAAQLTTPFRGVHSELWAITRNGRESWQLTNARDSGGAVLDPVFSYEGGLLLWSERVRSRRHGRYGDWVARLAEFEIKRGVPRLGKVTSHQAGGRHGLQLAEGFMPDERSLLLAGGASETVPDDGLDIVRYELASGAATALTESPTHRDAVARVSPDSERIVWASDRGIAPRAEGRLPARSDLWMMAIDGSGQERLTFFNHPDSDHYLGEAVITDLAWSPDGDRLAANVVNAGLGFEQAIWLVVLDPSYRR